MVRVRFAPSPTGDPHVGSAWAALFNWLFAKHSGGTFILRIEDTDRERFVPGSVERIYAMLDWLSLIPDEGPREGGPHAPYVQSERFETYRTAARDLVAKGAAYRCFCSSERLAELRDAQRRQKLAPVYDRRCRAISPEESERRAASEPFVVRLAIPEEGETVAEDIVRKTVRWSNRTLDDAVLLKSDGFPTYHLANVVDDHAMDISHVIRAEEWLPSLPKHLVLYAAFGWTPPRFAHLPLILGPDRAKLSKRHGHTAVQEYATEYLPEAFLNFLALMGWRPNGSDQEVFSREELVSRFDLADVRPSGAVFDLQKLRWLNGVWARRDPEATGKTLAAKLDSGIVLNAGLVHIAAERGGTLSEMAERIRTVLDPPSLAPKTLSAPRIGSPEAAQLALEHLSRVLTDLTDWTPEALTLAIHQVEQGSGVPGAQVQWAFRLALAHQNPSPPGVELAVALGKAETLKRVEASRTA